MLKGYTGVGIEHGKYVDIGNAADYAAKQCGIKLTDKTTEEFRNMFAEWFYSGNWVEDNNETI
jgi:hypothetical protein